MGQTFLVKKLKWSKCKLDSADGIGVLGLMEEGSVSAGWFQIPQPGKRSEAWLVASCRFPCVGHRGEYTCFPLVSNILAGIITIFP